jgi:outer membrane protein OmpU
MKHTLLASTALVALTSAASAEIKILGTARIGLVTTEGSALVAADTTYGISVADEMFTEAIDGSYTKAIVGTTVSSAFTVATTTGDIAATGVPTAGEVADLDVLRLAVLQATTAGGAATTATRLAAITDLASLDAVIARVDATVAKQVAATQDTTVGDNRVRISFSASGETDSGLAYGFSARADQSNTSNGGSQYISGAFGKISMGDLDGADEVTAGNLAGVGFGGAGSGQEFTYQSAAHNLGYQVSMSGVTFAASTDLVRGADATKTGSNSAMGIKWSGDVGGATVTIGLGQSKVDQASQDTYSAKIAMGGLTLTAISSTNDNGPAVTATGASTSFVSGTAHKAGVALASNLDTDHQGLSIGYAMDGMTVGAYTMTTSTSGKADADYTGVGFTYDLGGATLKAGFADSDNQSITDFGVSFSF